MNWKAVVEKKNAEIYRLPEGWDTRDKVADDLECSPERVSEILRPAIKAGEIEKKIFPVWDKASKRVLQVTAYRQQPVKK
jgi:hypothetical protein